MERPADGDELLDTVRVVMRPGVVISQVLVMTLLAVLAASAIGQRALGVPPIIILVVSGLALGLYLGTYAWARLNRIRDRWPLSELNAAAIALCGIAYAAPSRFVATPAYGLIVNTAFALGLVGGPVRGLGWTLAVGPLAMRVLFAPDPSPLSLLVSAASGAAAWWVYRLGARRWRERVAVRRAVRGEEERFAYARTRVASLATAMSLHDGVTGLFMALQRRLAATDTLAGLEPALRRAIERVNEALHPLPTEPPEDWAQALRELGAEFEVLVEWQSDVALATLPRGLAVDLWAIVWEAMANALAHGESPIVVSLLTDAKQLSLSVRTPSRQAPSEPGLGMRHIRLLAACWGGQASVDHRDDTHCLTVVVPVPTDDRKADAMWRWLLGPILGATLSALASVLDGHLPTFLVALVAQCLAAATAVSLYLEYRRSALDARRSRARDVEAGLESCRKTLGPLIAKLENSTARGAIVDVRHDVDVLFASVSALTRQLEDADPSSGATSLASPPGSPTSA